MRIPTASWVTGKNIYVGQWGNIPIANTTSQPTQIGIAVYPSVPGSTISLSGAGKKGQYTYGGETCTPAFSYTVGVVSTSFIDQNKWFLFQISVDWSAGIFSGAGLGMVVISVNGVVVSNVLSKGSGVQRDSDFLDIPWSNFTQPFNMAFNNLAFGFPGVYSTLATWASAEYADFQMWIGQALDFTSSAIKAKFFTVQDGRGYPVDPAVATAAFGTQQILFKGKASDASFYFNRGNGGSFSKIGTATDFTPGPSF